ncbi:hypothetical protein [Pseudonocardia pini]|uniref:hypothetical protein n=1 Tax=Pseudonocardia pini TaxID=2758030 RepID=UPI0028A8C218|nr:hypothetical protein [Pseudonocardia pini]
MTALPRPVSPPARPTVRATLADRRFLRHFAEMVVAMLLGMAALMPLWSLAGLPPPAPHVELHSLLMATAMTLPMSAWMLVRRHSWPAVGEMALAMYLPFVVLLVPFWAGLLGGHGVMVGGHVLMVPAMVAAMLHRREEYVGCP